MLGSRPATRKLDGTGVRAAENRGYVEFTAALR
jgi:hypothetical protein